MIFPKILDVIYNYHERGNFSDSSHNNVFESENNFRFLFFYEKYPKLGSEMWKLDLTTIISKMADEWNCHLEIFSCSS